MPLKWQAISPGEVGATRLENYTGDATEMLGYVQNTTDINLCYNYTYQILDKFCASQPKVRTTHTYVRIYMYMYVGTCMYMYVVLCTYTYVCLFHFIQGNFSRKDSEFKNEFGYRHCKDCLKYAYASNQHAT